MPARFRPSRTPSAVARPVPRQRAAHSAERGPPSSRSRQTAWPSATHRPPLPPVGLPHPPAIAQSGAPASATAARPHGAPPATSPHRDNLHNRAAKRREPPLPPAGPNGDPHVRPLPTAPPPPPPLAGGGSPRSMRPRRNPPGVDGHRRPSNPDTAARRSPDAAGTSHPVGHSGNGPSLTDRKPGNLLPAAQRRNCPVSILHVAFGLAPTAAAPGRQPPMSPPIQLPPVWFVLQFVPRMTTPHHLSAVRDKWSDKPVPWCPTSALMVGPPREPMQAGNGAASRAPQTTSSLFHHVARV